MDTAARIRARLELAAWDFRAWRARHDVARYRTALPDVVDCEIEGSVSLGRGGATYVISPIEKGSVIVSAGVGAEITFEFEAIERFGARVHALDPTVESAEFVSSIDLPDAFTFHPLALGGTDGPVELGTLKPASSRYRAVSALTGGGGGEMLRADAVRLSSLVDRIGAAAVDVLKLDIEGGEYPVLDDILEHGPLPSQLILEFHPHIVNLAEHGRFSGREGWEATGAMIARIRRVGYEVFHISDRRTEYSFILR